MADTHSTSSKDKPLFPGANQPKNPAGPDDKNREQHAGNAGAASSTADKVKDIGNTISQKAGDAAQRIGDSAAGLATKTKEAAAGAVEKTKGMASSAGQQVSEFASTVGDKAESATHSLGSEMKSLAGSIRDKVPEGSVLGTAAGQVAGCMEASGSYLEQNDFSHMAKDLSGLVRRYPVQAICAGLAVGFLVGRSTRS
jgi:hypothetical protein